MTEYLLDTKVISDMVRNPQGRIARRITETGDASIATSIIVTSELRFGLAKRGGHKLRSQVERILAAIPVLSFEPPADETYAHIRSVLEAAGKPIGANDTLIAAHAIALNRCLVTANTREFERVPGLKIENWLQG